MADDNLYDLLLDKLEGTPYSRYFSCCCPFSHNGSYELHPSMMVYEESTNPNYEYNCLSCHKHGTLKNLSILVNRDIVHGRDIKKHASNILPRWSKWERNYGDLDGIVNHAHKSLKTFPQFQAYFKKRKIEQFIDKGMFGYLDAWNLFPLFSREGKIIDIVVRAGWGKKDTRYVLHPDTNRESPYLYVPNWARVLESNVVYVPFGIIDSWSFEAIGRAAVTGSSGKSLNYELLKEMDNNFIFVPDKGEEKEAYRLANKLGWRADVRVISYPPKTKDPDSIRAEYGNQYFEYMIGA